MRLLASMDPRSSSLLDLALSEWSTWRSVVTCIDCENLVLYVLIETQVDVTIGDIVR
jgi:hypothetical protein